MSESGATVALRVWDEPPRNYDPIAQSSPPDPKTLADYSQLLNSDGTFVQNFQEHPQSILLMDSLQPTLERLHSSHHYAICQDCGIYWRIWINRGFLW